MPTIAPWDNLPPNARQHLIDRRRDRAISLADQGVAQAPDFKPG
jgi:hypothetical protein